MERRIKPIIFLMFLGQLLEVIVMLLLLACPFSHLILGAFIFFSNGPHCFIFLRRACLFYFLGWPHQIINPTLEACKAAPKRARHLNDGAPAVPEEDSLNPDDDDAPSPKAEAGCFIKKLGFQGARRLFSFTKYTSTG